MSDFYQRAGEMTAAADGTIIGTIATDGEASDGHILRVEGGELSEGAPLLFGHDDQAIPLGSWGAFDVTPGGRKLGEGRIRARGSIELEGAGATLEQRKDVAHMIGAGHLRGLSIRWAGQGVRRTSLERDHPAFVDAKSGGAGRHGDFFDTWRMLEASVVALPADTGALIGRMRETDGDVRRGWTRAVEAMLTDGTDLPPELADVTSRYVGAAAELRAKGIGDFGTLLRLVGDDTNTADLHEVRYGEGKRLLLPREAYDALTGESVRRLEHAFDLLSVAYAAAPVAMDDFGQEDTVRTVVAEEPARHDPEPTQKPAEDWEAQLAAVQSLNESSRAKSRESVQRTLERVIAKR